MCGIAGIVGPAPVNHERSELVRRMTATLAHRGPDGEGFATASGCDFGFRRLAIVDLTAPSTPLANEDQTILSVCNGEIYNGDELRKQLEAAGHRFRYGIDTEVLPHLYEEYGPALIERLDGMFAFAIWDAPRQRLVLGRDRAGEKPLYWSEQPDELIFGSELRAVLAHPRVARQLDPVALQQFLLHDYFPAPATPIAAIRKLPAAHLLIHERGRTSIKRYWDLADHYATARRSALSFGAAAERLDGLISQAVRRRSRSDVPVGVFLSGGIDSSAVLAHLTEQFGRGVPVFALGYHDLAFDESRFARETARQFGAEYHDLVLGESDLAEGLRRVGESFDEPLGDASIVPTHLLSLFARGKVKVVLSGEGGDELFAGYPTYIGDRVAEIWRRLPGALRRSVLAAARRALPTTMGNVGLDYLLGRFAEGCDRDRLERHQSWFGGLGPERHAAILSKQLALQLASSDPFAAARAVVAGRNLPDGLSQLLYTDFALYLQDDLLTKVDRASMLASLEVRAPLLDHELAEFAASLPSSYKLNRLATKRVLRRALNKRLSREVLTRRKRGFNMPFSRWVLNELGPHLQQRFATERVDARGLFSASGIQALLNEHLARQHDHRKPLFSLLAFDLWCDRTFGQGVAIPVAQQHSLAPRRIALAG